MRVLVTGGAGFIGGNLCAALAGSRPEWGTGDRRTAEVVVLDDLSSGFRSNLDGCGVRLVEGSILDPDALADATDGIDAVVHLAARPSVPRSLVDPVASHEANATGTLRVLEAARAQGAQVVVASSSSVYGSVVAARKHEDLPTRPLSPYGASKLATEAYCLAYGSSYGLPTLALRFFNVYGPLQAAGHAYAAVVPAFVDAALRGEPAHVNGDGRQTRDFTYVGSVVGTVVDALQRRLGSEVPVNLAFGTRTDLLGLLDELETVLGTPVARVHGDSRTGDIRDSSAEGARLAELFPDARAYPLADGLRATVDWFRRSGDYPEV